MCGGLLAWLRQGGSKVCLSFSDASGRGLWVADEVGPLEGQL